VQEPKLASHISLLEKDQTSYERLTLKKGINTLVFEVINAPTGAAAPASRSKMMSPSKA
jgi:hypothetical protein